MVIITARSPKRAMTKVVIEAAINEKIAAIHWLR